MVEFAGQQFGNYRLLRVLGRGSFAEVYLGEHIYLNSFAAIKLLHARLNDGLHESFLNEARMLAQLSHAHIIRILDFGIKEGIPFLVMEYAAQGTLRQHYPPHARLQLPTVVAYVKQISEGLDYAHSKKVIHRDLKPDNILIGDQGELLISDFGVALIVHTARSVHDAEDNFAGTAPYMAPEQLRGLSQFASDQYALGIMVYEWLCGTRPFHGTMVELYKQHLSAAPASLRQHLPQLPFAVDQVVLKALEKDPANRFVNAKAFADALEHASKHTSSVTPLFIPAQPERSAPSSPAGSQHLPATASPVDTDSDDTTRSVSKRVFGEPTTETPSLESYTTIPLSNQSFIKTNHPRLFQRKVVRWIGVVLLFVLGALLAMTLYATDSRSQKSANNAIHITPSVAHPTATATAKPCRIGSVSSNPAYQGNGYVYSNGGTYRSASKYCNGKVYFAFTSAPPNLNTQVRLCTTNTVCGDWVQYTTVKRKLLIMQNVAPGTSFHLQFRGYGATNSYMVQGKVYY